MQCANPACTNHFEPSRKDAIYCSAKCKYDSWKIKKKLNGLPNPAMIKDKTLTPPVALDAMSQFIVDTLKDDKKDLKEENKKLTEQLEKLRAEKTELEKQLEQTVNEINKKPTVLEGIFTDTDKLSNILQSVPGILAGLKELWNNNEPQQIAGIEQTAANASPLAAWLAQQPEDVQKLFTTLLQTIMRNASPAQTRSMISTMLTQSIRRTA